MNSRNSSTSLLRRTSRWCKAALLGAAFALIGTQAGAQVVVTGASVGNGSYATLGAAFTAVAAATGTIDMAIGPLGTTETATATLNAGAWTSIMVRPTVPGIVVTGNIVGAVVKLNGADNVTFDGRISGSGRNLTIQNTSTSTATAAVWFASVIAGNGVTGSTVRNCEIACGVTSNTSSNSSFGIAMCGTTISATANGTDNDNNSFIENRIIRCRYGIMTRGTTTNLNETVTITDNIVGPTAFGADQIGKVGILMQADNNATLTGNTVQFVGGNFANTLAGADRMGIAIGNESWSASAPGTITSTNYIVRRNLIHDIVEERTFSAVGLNLATTNGGTATNNVVCSNMIYNVLANGTTGDQCIGLGIAGGHSDQVVYNSIRMSGDVDPNASASACSQWGSGIRIANASSASHANLTLKNNIVYMDLSSSSGPTVRFYAITGNAAGYAFGTGGENNNDYYIVPSNTQCVTGSLGSASSAVVNTTQFATLALWQGAYTAPALTQDVASIQVDPNFQLATDLHINVGTTAVNNLGTTSGVTCTFDYDNTTRSGTPDIGADEYTPLVCAGADGGVISPTSVSKCVGQTYTMTSTGSTIGAGISNAWLFSLVPGGPYSPVSGGSGATTTSYTTAALTAGTYYYVMRNTCSFGGVDDSNELTVVVNALPTVTLTPSSGSICFPGGTPVVLTAGGAVTYAYSPTAGLTPTSGSPVSANPASTTTYTVTGTDANSCTNTATSAITVSKAPVNVTATATPPAVCTGSTSSLTSSAFVQNTASLANTYTFTGATGTYVPISGTVLGAGIIGDDVGIGNLPIGFTFNYNGTAETVFAVSSNGLIQLGNTSPTISGLSSNALASTAKVIAALWEDNNTTGSTVEYLTAGPSGSQVLTVQWTAMHVGSTGSSSNPTITVQIKLYEATGAVQIIYGSTSAALAGTTASIGISGAAANFISVTPLSPPNTSTTSTAVENTSISTAVNFPTGTTYTFTPPSLVLSYAWQLAGDVVSPGNQNTATNALAGTTTFTVTASNGACSNTATTTVTATPLSCSPATFSSPRCAGSNFTVTANTTGGGVPFNYTWSDGVTPTVYANAATITANLPAGSYPFTCSITDGCGGACNSNVTVVVNGLPSVSISPAPANARICDGVGSVVMTASGASTYAWSPVTGLAPTTGSPVTSTATSTTTYTVTGTDANLCVGTATQTVNVGVSPTGVTAGASSNAICLGGSVDLTSSATSPSPTLLTEGFESGASGWAFQDSSSTGVALASQKWHIETSPYTDATGSATFSSFSVTGTKFAYSNPDAGGSGSQTRTFMLSPAFSTQGYTGTATLSFKQVYRYWSSSSPVEQVKVQITSDNGATWTDMVNYSANVTPSVVGTTTNNAQAAVTVSLGIPAGFMNQPAVRLRWRYLSNWGFFWIVDDISVTGTPATYSYAWTSSPAEFTSGTQNPTGVTPLTATTYTYSVTVTGVGGCTAGATTAVAVTAPASGTFSYATPYCSTDGTASVTPVSLTGGGTYSSTPGLSITGGSGDVDLALSTAGTYTVTYTVAAIGGCPLYTTTAPISITAAPNAGGNGPTQTVCNNAAAFDLFALLTGSPQATGTWSGPGYPGNPLTNGNLGTFTPGTNAYGTFTYSVSPVSPCVGAPVTSTVTVNQYTVDSDSDGLYDCVGIDDCIGQIGTIGSYCDANLTPGFQLGQLDGNCVCQAVTCNQNVVLQMNAGSAGLASQMGYEILDQFSSQVICSGGTKDVPPTPYYNTTSTIPESCCLAPGKYRLRVYDSGGDGFITGGGYKLVESGANGRRIIENTGNFTTGSLSAILENNTPSSSAYSDNGAFEVPLGNVVLKFDHCDKLDWVDHNFIVCSRDAAVYAAYTNVASTTGYEFWFYDPNGGYSFRRFRNHTTSDGITVADIKDRACHFHINRYTPDVPAGTLLNVRVRPIVNGNFTTARFGPACFFKIDALRAACPLVKLVDNPADANFSCGSNATPVNKVFGGPNSTANKITSTAPQFQGPPPVLPANVRYQFRFRVPGELATVYGCITRPAQTSPTLYLNWTSGQKLACGATYEVDVRVSKNAGVDWCVDSSTPVCNGPGYTAWGKLCNITITTTPNCYVVPPFAGGSNSLALEGAAGTLTMYPNPNRGDQLFINMTGVETDVQLVNVDIYDMTGKKVAARAIPVQDGYLNTALDLNGDLSGGMYLVNITAGTKSYTERLVIQP